jgi:uncharacterized protein (DUF58 family)
MKNRLLRSFHDLISRLGPNDPGIHIQLNKRLLPALVLLLLILHLISPFDGWLVLLSGLGGLWLVSYLWAVSLATRLTLRREMRFGWAQVGDRLEERFTLLNRGLTPALWVEVIDYTNMPEYQVSRATGVGGFSENHWTTQGVCNHRGMFTLGPTGLRTGDPFGIYSVEVRSQKETHLIVTPPIVPLPVIQVSPGGRAGEGRPRPDAPERTVSAATTREYKPGDSLRWIHWRTTARREKLFVRLFEGTPAGDWWILLDLDRSVQAGEGQNSTEEHGVILAASLADRGLRQSRNVGLVINNQELAWLPPRQGEGQRWAILRTLALAAQGERPLAGLLSHMLPSFGRHSSLILITANTRPNWIEALLPVLRKEIVPTVLLIDPSSYGGSQEKSNLPDVLSQLGIHHYLITREILDRPEARPGQAGQWEWRISPTGKAIPIHKPRDMSWKEIS